MRSKFALTLSPRDARRTHAAATECESIVWCHHPKRNAHHIHVELLYPDNDVTNRVHGIQSSAEIMLLLLKGHAVEETYGNSTL